MAASGTSLGSDLSGLIHQMQSFRLCSEGPEGSSRVPIAQRMWGVVFLGTSCSEGCWWCEASLFLLHSSLPSPGPCPTGGTESSPSSTVEKPPSLAPFWNRATAAPAPMTSLPARAPFPVPWVKGPPVPTALQTTAHAVAAATPATCWPRGCAGQRWPSPWRTFLGWRRTCRTWS